MVIRRNEWSTFCHQYSTRSFFHRLPVAGSHAHSRSVDTGLASLWINIRRDFKDRRTHRGRKPVADGWSVDSGASLAWPLGVCSWYHGVTMNCAERRGRRPGSSLTGVNISLRNSGAVPCRHDASTGVQCCAWFFSLGTTRSKKSPGSQSAVYPKASLRSKTLLNSFLRSSKFSLYS